MGSVLEETRVFEKLIDALSSKFSLREIASAYCKAGRDPDLAAQILYGNYSNAAAAVVTTTQCGGTSSDPSLCESIANKPDKGAVHKSSKPAQPDFSIGGRVSYAAVAAKSVLTTTQYGGTSSDSDSDSCESIADKPYMGADRKGSKSTEMAFSVGSSVSPSVVGGGYYPMHNTPSCCLICGPKPLGVDSKDFPVDELIYEKDQMHTDPFVAGKVLGRTVEVNKAVPRGEHNSPYSPKGFKKSNDNDGQFRTRKIFVGGLPPSLTEEEFKSYFEKFGRTTKVYTVCDTITHQPRGFGFVNFDSEEAVEDVMQKRFHELNGKVVEVKRHVPKDRSNNGHSGGKGYAMHKTPAYGPVSPAKQLKVGIKDFPFDELTDDDVTSDSRVEDYQKHTDHEGSKQTGPSFSVGNRVTYAAVAASAAVLPTIQCGTSSDSSLCESTIADKPDSGADHKGSKPTEPAAFSVGSCVSYAAVAAASVRTTTQCGTSSDSSLCESIGDKPDKGADDKVSKLTEPAFSVGSRVSYAAVAAASVRTTTQYGGTSSDSDSSCESIANQPNAGADHKGSNPTELASSVGSSISASVVGDGYYAMRNTPGCCLICGPKPLKVDI